MKGDQLLNPLLYLKHDVLFRVRVSVLSILGGVKLCLDDGVPVEALPTKVLDKVQKRFETLGKELEERMSREDTHGQYPPLLDAHRLSIVNLPDGALTHGRQRCLGF